MRPETDESQLRTVYDALEFAFSVSDKSTVRTSSTQTGSRSTNLDIPTDWDKLAYAQLILKCLKSLSLYSRNAIELHLSREHDVIDNCANYIGRRVATELNMPMWFTIDVCRDWANYGKMHKMYKDWEHNLKIGRTALWQKKIQIQKNIEKYELVGLAESETDLINRGIIKFV